MKIHFLSDSPKMNSGYAIVCRNLAVGLKKLGHDISMTGLQTAYAPEYLDDCGGGKIEIMPIQSDKADDVGQFMNNLQNISPDICIYIGDMDMDLNPLAKVYPGTWVYTPVNGKDVPFGIAGDLNGIVKKGGKVIAMCKYGLTEMKMAGVNVDRYIYHGYNSGVFKKIEKFEPYCYYATSVGQRHGDPRMLCEKGCYNCKDNSSLCQSFKEEIVSILKWDNGNKRWSQHDIGISKIKTLLNNKFIYLSVSQNVGLRKRLERLLRAYAIVIKDSKQFRDRTHLHMHCLPISGRGLNLIEVAMKLGIQDNISFSYGSYLSAGWSEEAVNVLYNLADVHVSASSSEGFGIPTAESMACGLPNIAPDCTSFTELIGNDVEESKNRGLLAKISDWQYEPVGRYKPLVSQESLAVLMKKIYVDEKLREILGNNGMEWVKQFSWDKICNQWNKLIE